MARGLPSYQGQPGKPVRGPKYSVKKGKTAVLSVEEARKLLDTIDPSSHVGLRDRALIALMVYTFAPIGAALKMRVEDVYTQKRRTWVRLHEKGGKRHESLVKMARNVHAAFHELFPPIPGPIKRSLSR